MRRVAAQSYTPIDIFVLLLLHLEPRNANGRAYQCDAGELSGATKFLPKPSGDFAKFLLLIPSV